VAGGRGICDRGDPALCTLLPAKEAVTRALQADGSILISDTVTRKYYAFGGQNVAMVECNSQGCGGLNYFLTDHLGSVVAVVNASGGLVSQQRYLPFGEVRTDVGTITQTDYGFTGQRALDAQGNGFSLGLMDYKARFYDVYSNHFIQPDSITPGGPQGLNRYSYVLNNPVNSTDPTGHMACEGTDGDCNGSSGGGNPTNPCSIDPNLPQCGKLPPTPKLDEALSSDTGATTQASSNSDPMTNWRINFPELDQSIDFQIYKISYKWNLGVGTNYPNNPITIAVPPQVRVGNYSMGTSGINVRFGSPPSSDQQVANSIGFSLPEEPVYSATFQTALKSGDVTLFQKLTIDVEVRPQRFAAASVALVVWEVLNGVPYDQARRMIPAYR
jgi:RHS repeat-associated protein